MVDRGTVRAGAHSGSGTGRPVRDAGQLKKKEAVDRHGVHKDPASSAASHWTLASMYIKPSDGVQGKLGGQPLVEL